MKYPASLLATFALPIALTACGSADVTQLPGIGSAKGIIVFDGNSLTSPLHGHTPYPDFVMEELGHPTGLAAANVAVPGQTTPDMILRGPSQVDRLHSPGPVNIVVMWEGTNDMYFGATPEAAYQHLVNYATARRAAGWYVVVLTLMPRTGINTRHDFEDVRQRLNAMIRANWRSFADQLADVAADRRFGADGAELNITYFEDSTHLTQFGIEKMADLVTPMIRRAIFSQMR